MDPITLLLVVGVIGLVAQLVDGALGMGDGVTSATLLAAVGSRPQRLLRPSTWRRSAPAWLPVPPIGGSGTSWRAMIMLAVPGFLGAFVGAVVLSNIDGSLAAPWVAVVLSVLGGLIFVRTVFGRTPTIRLYSPRLRTMGPLGVVGGFIDSIGGGGWAQSPPPP